MTASTTTPEVTRYRDAVRAALADLSAEDRDDLMEDVESHLTEVAAENEGSLARLGSPTDYAAELRTSAGLPLHNAPAVRASLWARLSAAVANSAAGRGLERLTTTRGWQSFRSFLPELRPGWWVLRGYLVVWAIAGVFFGDSPLVPRINNSSLLGLLLTAVGIWASVRLGMRARSHPPRRARRIWGRVFVGVLLLVTFGLLVSDNPGEEIIYYDGGQQTGLVGVRNVYVFDSEGRPLTGVQLFDQDGNPLQADWDLYDANGMPVTVRPYRDANGNEVYNVYPRDAAGYLPVPQIIAPRLTRQGSSSNQPSPGASATTAPSAGPVAPSASPSPR